MAFLRQEITDWQRNKMALPLVNDYNNNLDRIKNDLAFQFRKWLDQMPHGAFVGQQKFVVNLELTITP